MMSEQRPDGKPTLEDLLRVKRAERPPADFWVSFERELRTRQLAAAVQKPRWWSRMPRLSGFARYQVPMGAAAVLAVTFLTLREYREPGFETAYPVPTATAADRAEVSPTGDEEGDDPVIDLAPVTVATYVEPTMVRQEPMRRQATSNVASANPEDRVEEQPRERALSPSARSIAVNLAAVEPELGSVLGRSGLLATPSRTMREPLAELTALRDARREPLFAYNSDLSGGGSDRDGSQATHRIGSRINETELYDSVRRLSGGGDRLTLRF